jgi:hypothetical protein
MRSDTGRRELKQAGDSAERLRELVEGKQRQVEVLSARKNSLLFSFLVLTLWQDWQSWTRWQRRRRCGCRAR